MLAPWRRPYRTADGHVCTLIYTDAQWRRFWEAVKQPEMMNDPRFKDMAARSRNIEDVYRIAEAQFASKTTQEWITLFDQLEIPAGPVKSLEEVLDDEHLKAIGFFKHFAHPTEGDVVMPTCHSVLRLRRRESIGCRRGSVSTAGRCSANLACRRPKSMRWRRQGTLLLRGHRPRPRRR